MRVDGLEQTSLHKMFPLLGSFSLLPRIRADPPCSSTSAAFWSRRTAAGTQPGGADGGAGHPVSILHEPSDVPQKSTSALFSGSHPHSGFLSQREVLGLGGDWRQSSSVGHRSWADGFRAQRPHGYGLCPQVQQGRRNPGLWWVFLSCRWCAAAAETHCSSDFQVRWTTRSAFGMQRRRSMI